MTASDYRITIIDSIEQLSKERWQQLAKNAGPFISYEFLHALESSGSCENESGWQPCHIAITCVPQETVSIFIPGFLKTHSYGEYVFDHAWANAYAQHGLDYYPKWISAIPFTPVSGPRLLSDGRTVLTPSLVSEIEHTLSKYVESEFSEALSSFHWLFPDENTSNQLTNSSETQAHYLTRYAVQFQWHNYGYDDFEDFLNALTSRKRKDIKKSRRKLSEQGVRFTHHTGSEISPETLQFFTKCYKATYLKRSGHVGYLNDAFFEQLVETMSDNMLIVTAVENEIAVASALFFYDETGLYGRYWGALKEIDGLHFACCYFEGIEFAISRKLQLFNPGTQGEHKILRGFEPIYCRSHHKLRHASFHSAVADFLQLSLIHI